MTKSDNADKKVVEETAVLQARIEELESELSDVQMLYDITMEHGATLENELMAHNDRMEALQDKMRKFLSPQLFQALIGGTADASTTSHARIKLTVYFSDIVGFSDLTDNMEPELLSTTLNSYLTRMSEIALKYGGTIDKFIGDAVMVFFGAPEFDNDAAHAERCVRMALEMRDALIPLREKWARKGIPGKFQVRAGINSGICTVGNFGSDQRMDYTIIGNQVNMASRLESIAPPDCIYLSDAAYALVENLVEADFIGPRQMKGIHRPVDVWELIGLKEDNTAVSTYLNVQDNHFELKTLDLDLTTLSDDERVSIQKALSRALIHLSPRPEPNSEKQVASNE